jgi:hypothetical protein
MTSSAALHEHADRPALQLEPVMDAARAALRPPGPVRWILDPRPDRVELRAVIRRWSTAVEPVARLARVAAGTALRAARLAVAVQGREPLVSHPDQPGVLAVLHAGGAVAPRREELALHAMLRHATDPAPVRVGNPDRTAVLRLLRRAAEAEGAWLRALPQSPAASATLGPCWYDPDEVSWAEPVQETFAAVIGAPGRPPAADLRSGQAVETVRLTARALGLDLQVLAAPVATTTPAITRRLGPTTDTLAIVQIGRLDQAEDRERDLSDISDLSGLIDLSARRAR